LNKGDLKLGAGSEKKRRRQEEVLNTHQLLSRKQARPGGPNGFLGLRLIGLNCSAVVPWCICFFQHPGKAGVTKILLTVL